MPLPESWFGPFYSPNQEPDHLMVDLPPEMFLSAMQLTGQNPAFSAAAAYVDCRLNGMRERAECYLCLGKSRYVYDQWGPLEKYVAVVEEQIARHPEWRSNWCDDLYETVVELFEDFLPPVSGGRVQALGPLLS